MKNFTNWTRLIGGFAFLAFGVAGFATPIGHLDTNGCAGNGVVVTATTIDWDPAGTGLGCITTGATTSVTYAGGTLLPSTVGSIKDLPAGPVPVINFMTFAGAPSLHFDLGGLSSGPANTNCAALNNFEVCAAFAGSPFALQLSNGQTIVSLGVFGTVSDGVAPSATWLGSFSVTLSNLTPAQIQSIIAGGGSVSSTHAGNFTLSSVDVPELDSIVLLGMGLLLCLPRLRRS